MFHAQQLQTEITNRHGIDPTNASTPFGILSWLLSGIGRRCVWKEGRLAANVGGSGLGSFPPNIFAHCWRIAQTRTCNSIPPSECSSVTVGVRRGGSDAD